MSTAKTATILTRTEPETKRAADILFSKLGMTTAGAINIFLHQAIEERALPFKVTMSKANIPDLDALSKEEVIAMLDESRAQVEQNGGMSVKKAFTKLRREYGL